MAAKKNKIIPASRWSRYVNDTLLDMRVCDLGLTIEKSPVAPLIKKLNRELEAKRLLFHPHFWISDEWFCPDGVPGVSIPFFLMHARLKKLELENMLEVEGGDPDWCMMLLRHETGHALLNAYKLNGERQWRKTFGNPNTRYPDAYLPKPYSKRYVLNLPGWYAQSHPHEDWAETFAVWLNPRSDWRKRYQNWPALKKLQYVEELMISLQDKKPLLRNKRTEYPVEKIRITLREFYTSKRERYGVDSPQFFEIDLRKLFVPHDPAVKSEKASRYIRRVKKDIIDVVERWTGEYKYRINEVLKDMIARADELNLRVDEMRPSLMPDLSACLTMLVMNKLHYEGFHITR